MIFFLQLKEKKMMAIDFIKMNPIKKGASLAVVNKIDRSAKFKKNKS